MAKNKSLFICLLFIVVLTSFNSDETDLSLREIYSSQIGVRELTGKNDGQEVEMYLHSVGLKKGYAWCSAFVHWCLDSAKIKNSVNAFSPTAENKKNIVYKSRTFFSQIKSGDVFTIFYPSLKRIGHTGFVDRKLNSSIVETVEGNTNDASSREGDGVYRRKRSINSLYSISRW